MPGVGRTFKRGKIWHIEYRHRNKKYRQSSGSQSEATAKRALKEIIARCMRGEFTGADENRIMFADLVAGIEHDYRVNERRSGDKLSGKIKILQEFFGEMRAIDISPAQVKRFIDARKAAGRENPTINRDLAALIRMFKIAVEDGLLGRAPKIKKLIANNARQGFFDHGSYLALIEKLPEYARGPVSFLYLAPWRTQEVLTLLWTDIDLPNRMIRLRRDKSKNGHGRQLPVNDKLMEVIQVALARRRSDCPYVFHRDGKRMGGFRKAWKRAVAGIGQPNLIMHDLKRTSLRNIVRAGTSERVAMDISGHRTRSVFDRYNITSEKDLRDAMDRAEQYLDKQSTAPVVVPLGRKS